MTDPYKDFTFKLNGKEYIVAQEKVYGFVTENPVVYIDPNQKGSNELDSWIHELLHVIHPDWPEKNIREVSAYLSTILYRAGYRRIPRKTPCKKTASRNRSACPKKPGKNLNG